MEKLENVVAKKGDGHGVTSAASINEYRENIRKLMHDELRNALDEEIHKASQELLEEQRKAIRLILEEHKAAIRQVVDEEKKSIWEKAELLRQSILKFGL
jgi:dsDNA-binding SOS-regulon protein